MKTFGRFLLRLFCFAVLAVVITYFSIGWLRLTGYVTSSVREAHATVVESIANASGFVRPEEPMTKERAIELVEVACFKRNINPSVCRAVISTESVNDPKAISPAGALGIMQVMPIHLDFCKAECGTTKRADLLDAKKNACCGSKVLDDNLKYTKGNLIRALRRFNGGWRCEFNHCAETDAYVPTVLAKLGRDTTL
jgi:soluble lytic murein transglycosylase-like protein